MNIHKCPFYYLIKSGYYQKGCQVPVKTNEKLTVIVRDPQKVKHLAKQGVTVIAGSHADPDVMIQATKGAKALFVLTPASMAIENFSEYYKPFAKASAAAIEKNAIPYVVHLSSIGGDKDSGTGPIIGLHHNEEILRKASKNIVQMRPSYFMENTLGQIGSIASMNKLFTSFPSDLKLPMIAVKDIGVKAAELLKACDWTGEKIVELQGYSEISYGDVAKILSEVLNKPLEHVTITGEQMAEAFLGMGASKTVAHGIAEMGDSIMNGHINFYEPRNEANTTPTSFPEFAQTVYKAVYEMSTKQ